MTVVLRILVLVSVFVVPTLARARVCRDLFHTVIRMEEVKFSRSERFRVSLLERAAIFRAKAFAAENKERDSFIRQFDSRYEVSPEAVRAEIQSSKILAEVGTIVPEIYPHLLRDTLRAMDDKSLDPRALRARLERDPYILWLQENSLSYTNRVRVVKGAGRETKLIQAEPVEMYMRMRADGLPAEIALMLVQSKLDPVLREETRATAKRAYTAYLSRIIFDRDVLPYLSVRARNEAAAEAWMLLPTLKQGRRKLRLIYDEQIAKYKSTFSLKNFERASALMSRAESDPSVATVFEYMRLKNAGVEEAEILRRLEDGLLTLRLEVGLPPTFPLADLFAPMKYIFVRKKEVSYDAFIMDQFAYVEDPKLGETMWELNHLIDIAALLQDEKYVLRLIGEKVIVEMKKLGY